MRTRGKGWFMLKKFALSSCVAALACAGQTAVAADLDEIIFAPQLPMTQPVEIGSGWYLRGDLGYSVNTGGAPVNFTNFSAGPPPVFGTGTYSSGDIDSDWSGSIGMGYQFTDYLRADLTFDYSQGGFSGNSASAAPCAGMPAGTSCATADSTDFTSYGFMANGYLDLGTISGITPYLGAGAGFTRMIWDPMSSRSACVGAGCTPIAAVSHPGEESWRFTYALMAGLSYDISPSLKLDVGYRYQKTDGGDMYGFGAAAAAAGATGTQAYDDGIEKHEIRAGLRYLLW